VSRATVRAAVASWFNAVDVPQIDTLLTSFPEVIPASMFTTNPGQTSGCVGVIFISGEIETRIATGGATSGWKEVDYTVELHLFHRAQGSPAAAMDAFDALIEAVKVRARADRTWDGTVWQAGTARLEGVYGEPKLNGSVVETWGQLIFNVIEMVQA
jgi:hypothetical protein